MVGLLATSLFPGKSSCFPLCVWKMMILKSFFKHTKYSFILKKTKKQIDQKSNTKNAFAILGQVWWQDKSYGF